MYIISLAWPRAGIRFHCILSINQTFLSPHPLACVRHTHTHTHSLSGSCTSNACPSATPSALHHMSFSSGAAVVLFRLFLLSELMGGPLVCHTPGTTWNLIPVLEGTLRNFWGDALHKVTIVASTCFWNSLKRFAEEGHRLRYKGQYCTEGNDVATESTE